jgi:hypothetical protein
MYAGEYGNKYGSNDKNTDDKNQHGEKTETTRATTRTAA